MRKISSELRDVAKNGVNLPVFEPNDSEKNSSNENFSKAQENRLADVYKAKMDILGRISKGLSAVQEAEKNFTLHAEEQRKFITEWSEKLEELKKLEEPENLKDLTQYIRTVEHFRMDFFSAEARFEQELGRQGTNKASDLSGLDISCFYSQIRSMVRLMIILIVALISMGILISATIWFSMNL